MESNKNLFYRIVHKFTPVANNQITLNPISFPFNGLCKVVVESVNFNQLNIAVGTTSSVFITMDSNQPYSQDNLNTTTTGTSYNPTQIIATIPNTVAPYNAYNSIPDTNECITHLNPTQVLTLNVCNDAKTVLTTGYTSCVVVLRIYKLD